jgi:hypothetical protein
MMYSFDGITWATTTNSFSLDLAAVTFANGHFVAVGGASEGGGTLIYSTDGITWFRGAPYNNSYWNGVTYGNGRFVAVASAFSQDMVAVSTGLATLGTNASTTNLTIATTTSTLNASNSVVSVTGNYTNNGVLTAASSTFVFNGTTTQSATGTLSATSSFNNLILDNQSGNGTTSRSIIFGAPLTVTATSTITASTSVEFLSGATTTFNNVSWQGGATSPIYIRSTATGTQSFLTIMGNKLVTNANVRDSNATSTSGGIVTTLGTNVGNNINWFFGEAATSSLDLTLGNHSLGQVTNTFSSTDKPDEPLFAFTLTPGSETATTTNLRLDLSNVIGIDSTNLSDWRLYRDYNANRTLDGGDEQIGGAGIYAATGTTASTTFTTPFLASTSLSYIITADITGIEQGDRITLSLSTSGISASSTVTGLALPIAGTISSTNHLRSKKGGGSGSVNFINLGAPGNGIETGGGENAGEELGGLPNFNSPTTNGSPHNEWTTGGNGYLSDGSYTTETTAGQRQSYATYGFNIPSTNEITGIEVKLEASASTPAGTIEVALSWDNGVSITTTRTTATLSTTDTIYTLGSPSDLWGRAWVPSEFGNGTFGLRLIGQPSGGNTVQVDAMQVRIYHQATGGSAGVDGGEL